MYVERDPQTAKIVNAFGVLQPGVAEEWLEENDPGLIEFNHPQLWRMVTAVGFKLELNSRSVKIDGSPVNLLTAVTAAVNGEGMIEARIMWENATAFERLHPLVERIGAGLGLDGATLDAIFQAASARDA